MAHFGKCRSGGLCRHSIYFFVEGDPFILGRGFGFLDCASLILSVPAGFCSSPSSVVPVVLTVVDFGLTFGGSERIIHIFAFNSDFLLLFLRGPDCGIVGPGHQICGILRFVSKLRRWRRDKQGGMGRY